MSLGAIQLRHWLALAGLALVIAITALLWSTRGLGYRDPKVTGRTTSEFSRLSATDRSAARARFSLLCLDSLSRTKPQEAVRYCSQALEVDPENGAALNLRGNAYVFLAEYTKAIADFSSAIRLAPDNPEAYRFRARAYAAQHRDRLALADFDRAIMLAPDDPIGVELRGHFHQERGSYALALADFSSVIAVRPGLARAWNSRCWTRVLAGRDYSAALSDCDKAIALDPANANSFDSRGFVYLRLNGFRKAVADFDQALQRQPRLASALFGRALAKLYLRDLSAPKDLAAAKAIEPGIESRFLRFGFKLPVTGPSGT